ncbi:MAG: TetR/AcrR family transcriptional regulator [Oceanospirillaceae bacterium]|nr:TetR/AcrR family transcriptional regulator [Oceanospirillaceae bacterium]
MARKSANSRDEILDAAAECFMEMGIEAASISDIARRLGATKGRVYHHFASKGALLSDVRIHAIDTMSAALEEAIDFDLPPEQNFYNMAHRHVTALLKTLPYHKVDLQKSNLSGEKSTTPYERELLEQIRVKRTEYGEAFRKVIAQGIETGVFRKVQVSVTLHSVLVLLNAPVFWYQSRGEDPAAEQNRIADELATLALNALLARPDSATS